MEKREFYEVVNKLLDQYGAEGCEHCPYAEQCEARELYWGCGVWEEQMGEDLQQIMKVLSLL